MEIEQRLLYAGITALIAGLVTGPFIIPLLRRLKVGQTIREDGPVTHFKKSGTPTMGGVLFIIGVLLASLVWTPANMRSPALAWLWLVLGFGVIGFVDDYIKVVKRQSLGLRAREKLIGQVLVSGVFYLMIRWLGVSSSIAVPFAGWSIDLGWLYLPFVIIWAIGFSNAVNLTDGVDGLVGSTMTIAALAYLLTGLVTGNTAVAVLNAALIGGLLAFLRFNWHPARVFMGDVGSLALGGALAGSAILTKTELSLLLIGLVFVLETLSVIIQVVYFRLSGGKRIFRMAPVHHHFELVGWPELKVVVIWCLLGALGGLLGLAGLAGLGL